jgi:hypothetical protein
VAFGVTGMAFWMFPTSFFAQKQKAVLSDGLHPHQKDSLSLTDRRVFEVAFADVFGAGADQFVVAVLFEDMAGPA